MKQMLVLSVLTLLIPMPLMAQNVLLNPGFDTDILNWDNIYSGMAVWDSRDANDSALSGSAVVTNELGNGGSNGILSQCFDVSEGAVINYSAKVYQPSGQTGEGYGHLRIRFYSEPACQSYLSSGNTSSNDPTFDTWIAVSGSDTAIASSASVRVYLAVVGTISNENFSVHFDDVVMTIVNDLLFADDFEDGTTDAWTSVVP